MQCPNCKSTNVIIKGKYWRSGKKTDIDHYLCQDCYHLFIRQEDKSTRRTAPPRIPVKEVKECPKCGSPDIGYEGWSTATGKRIIICRCCKKQSTLQNSKVNPKYKGMYKKHRQKRPSLGKRQDLRRYQEQIAEYENTLLGQVPRRIM